MVSEEELLELARLAKLELSTEDKQDLLSSLPKILEYVKQLESLEVASIDPTIHVHGAVNAFREDKAESSSIREEILKRVPQRVGDYISTPLVIDETGEG